MATVQLADIYDAKIFNPAMQEASVELDRFVQAGILTSDPVVDAAADAPGKIGDLPFYFGLTHDEPNYSSDDPATNSTPAKISSETQIWRKAMMNKSWSTMDLSRELAVQDPLAAIVNRVGGYWASVRQRRLIQTCLGVLADNVANDSGDMLYSIATDAAGAPTAAEKISGEAVIMAGLTMGDHAANLGAIAMHSVVYSSLQVQNLIEFISPLSDSKVRIPTYLGMTVIVDDMLPAVAGTNRITYTSILFAPGAFSLGIGTPPVPSEYEREPSAGNGGGQDIIHTRKTEIIHPNGFAFTGSPAADSATEAELAAATSWNRVYENRKNIPVAFLQTNG